MKPLVTVIIYYSKDRGWLNEAIKSVQNQRYDGRIELLEENNPDFNASQNLNEGIKKAKGKYIRYLSEDDILPYMSIYESVRLMEETDADFMHGNAINFWGYPVFNEDGYITFSGRVEKYIPKYIDPNCNDLLKLNVIHGGTVMYKASVLKENLFDETLTSAEEWDVNLKLLKQGYRLEYLDSYVYFYRRHEKQKSLGKGVSQADRNIIKEKIRKRYE